MSWVWIRASWCLIMVSLSYLTDWLCHYHSISLPLLPTVQLLLYWAMRKRFSISLKIKNRKRDIRRFRTKSFVTFFRSFYDSHLPWGRVIICYKILPPPPLYPLKFKGLYFLSTTQQKKKSARISNENDLERFLVEQKPTGVPQLVSFGAASFALKGILPTSNFVQGK